MTATLVVKVDSLAERQYQMDRTNVLDANFKINRLDVILFLARSVRSTRNSVWPRMLVP